MKGIGIVIGTGFAIVGVVGLVMAATNPAQPDYETFAAQRLGQYLKENECPKVKTPDIPLLGNSLKDQCIAVVDANQATFKQLIMNNTQRQNFIIFSLYKTDLSLKTVVPFLPSYHVETLAAFQSFQILKTEQR